MALSRAARRRRAVVRSVVGTTAFLAVVAGGAAGVAAYLRHLESEPEVVRCAALLDGTQWYLEPDQAETAALLSGTSLRRGLPARATTIALATGLQESKLHNIEHGDRDSVGIFQQRPSQGWGTVEQIMDPVYATNAFYDSLIAVPGYQDLPITQAAQAVQRSGFPEAYAQHEARARAWATAMYGYTPQSVTCTLPTADGPGDAASVQARVDRDLGLPTSVDADGAVEVDASTMAATADAVERMGWAVAHWAVAVAEPLRIEQVGHGGQTWDRASGGWTAAPDDTTPAGRVRIVLAR